MKKEVRSCETITWTKLPQDFCCQAAQKNRRKARSLSRFLCAAWRQKDKARCSGYCFTAP